MRSDGVAVAWLTVSPATEVKRFTSGTHRPWYGDDPLAFLSRQARERDPAFRSLDPVIVATDQREPEAVADALFAGIEEDRFLILPHPEVAGYYQARAADPDRWMTNMNHLQQKWETAE